MGFFYSQFFFTSLNLPPKQIKPSRTDSVIHVFLAEGVGGASIASDRGSAPRKGMERFLQPMGEGPNLRYYTIWLLKLENLTLGVKYIRPQALAMRVKVDHKQKLIS